MFHKIKSIVIIATFVMQIIFLYILVNPINAISQLESVQTINKISNKVTSPLPINELPQIGVVGDGKMLASIEEIKKGNAIDAEIYQNAADKDIVLGYTTKTVIYRPSTDAIVYEGDSPNKKLQGAQQGLVNGIVAKIQAANLIPKDNVQVPQLSVVSNPDEVRKGNEFYKDIQKDDIIATFSNPNLVVIYRPSTGTIVKSGQIQVSIK